MIYGLRLILSETVVQMRITCGGLLFFSDFDSGNLASVEQVLHESTTSGGSSPDKDLNHQTKDDFSTLCNRDVKQEVKNQQNCLSNNQSSLLSNRKSIDLKTNSCLSKACSGRNWGTGGKQKSSNTDSNGATSSSSSISKETVDLEFNVWTKPDCAGYPYENGNRTWFYFGVQGGLPGVTVCINVMNLNRQNKLFSQGMAPVYRVIPGKATWQRIPNKPSYSVKEGNFVLTFLHKLPSHSTATTYFAFTFPFSYNECQEMLTQLDKQFGSGLYLDPSDPSSSIDNIYYCREVLCYSLDGHKVELVTVTSLKGMLEEREDRLPYLFPHQTIPRCHKFQNKKIVFISSRVHPGETPSSFVLRGFLHFILATEDPRPVFLRDNFVFKLIPILNPDGVVRGHYRMDVRGVNLNRKYLTANLEDHPAVYSTCHLLLYYHSKMYPLHNCVESSNTKWNSYESFEVSQYDTSPSFDKELLGESLIKKSDSNIHQFAEEQKFMDNNNKLDNIRQISPPSFFDFSNQPLAMIPNKAETSFGVFTSNALQSFPKISKPFLSKLGSISPEVKLSKLSIQQEDWTDRTSCTDREGSEGEDNSLSSFTLKEEVTQRQSPKDLKFLCNSCLYAQISPEESGIYCYVDLHGHASKRGCFLYGNYFTDCRKRVESLLLAKLMTINSPNFDFNACNFTEQNMYGSKKHDGSSKEGSGRVALYTLTGITHSYTLECNYNTGRSVNIIPPVELLGTNLSPPVTRRNTPPPYTPEIFEQVGRALAVSLLDLINKNPVSRLPLTPYRTLDGVREWLWKHLNIFSTWGSPIRRSRYHSWSGQSLPSSTICSPGKKNSGSPKASVRRSVSLRYNLRRFRQSEHSVRSSVSSSPSVRKALSLEQLSADLKKKKPSICRRLHFSYSQEGLEFNHRKPHRDKKASGTLGDKSGKTPVSNGGITSNTVQLSPQCFHGVLQLEASTVVLGTTFGKFQASLPPLVSSSVDKNPQSSIKNSEVGALAKHLQRGSRLVKKPVRKRSNSKSCKVSQPSRSKEDKPLPVMTDASSCLEVISIKKCQ
ncbi:cytosolic carboxypeptidase-like protein 5 [Tachypleus tridentatus]|uniref:cytosolic carboxypeptidase-like protein 5 n=1 Tax=Tachypleus tridentatus TaxID=6853 RepID=UPI003FD0D580